MVNSPTNSQPMYIPEPFHETSTSRIRRLVARHPFATLISVPNDTPTPLQPIVSQLPLLLDPSHGEHGVLRGHLARANPHWRELTDDHPGILAGLDAGDGKARAVATLMRELNVQRSV